MRLISLSFLSTRSQAVSSHSTEHHTQLFSSRRSYRATAFYLARHLTTTTADSPRDTPYHHAFIQRIITIPSVPRPTSQRPSTSNPQVVLGTSSTTTLAVHSLLLRVTWLANDPVGDRSDYPTTIYAQHSISYLAPTAWSFIHNCRNMSCQVALFESVRLPPIDSRAFHCNYSMHARTISNYQSHLSRHQRRRMDGWMPGLMHHLSI
jgi:hypothetical protein